MMDRARADGMKVYAEFATLNGQNYVEEHPEAWAINDKHINELKPGTLLGLYHCPRADDEFDGARRRILGLDYDLLREPIDVFSPMVYHAHMARDPQWVAENIEWFCRRVNIRSGEFPKVWPIVQAYNSPYTISPEEFETVLRGGMAAKASGVMMFTTRAVADEDSKIEVMKRVYEELGE